MEQSEYLEEVVRIVRTNLHPGKQWITAAALGTYLRNAHPTVSWKDFGYRNLAEFLNDTSPISTLKVVLTDKGALAVTLDNHSAVVATHHVETYNPLRKAVWEAFALPAPPGKRFMNRLNGSVRIGLEAAPSPADEWVELEKIGLAEQKRWGVEFVEERLLESPFAGQATQLLESSAWHPHQFGLELEALHEGWMRQWNRYRTSCVSRYVKNWLLAQNLPIEWAFQTKLTTADSFVADRGVPHSDHQGSAEETKKLILSALSLMSAEQLLEIPIPSRFILSALSSSKAR